MRVVAVARDLMDRSKIAAALPDAELLRAPEIAGSPDVVLVDLTIEGALDVAVASGGRVLAFGSHVDDETLDAARERGAEALPRSVFFRRLAQGTLLD